MHPRTLAALAVSAGLIIATGVLAVGSSLLPSGATPRPVTPVAAAEDIAPAETPTTIVTDVQDVFDLPPARADASGTTEPSSDSETASVPPAASTDESAPASSAAPEPPAAVSVEHDTDETEHESDSPDDHQEVESHNDSSSESGD